MKLPLDLVDLDNLSELVMDENQIICFFISFFLTISLGKGLKRDGPKWDITLPSSYKEPCVSILATDLAPYQRKLLSMPIFLLHLMLSTRGDFSSRIIVPYLCNGLTEH